MTEIQLFLSKAVNEATMIFQNRILIITLLIFLIVATYTDLKEMKIYNKFNAVFLGVRILFATPFIMSVIGKQYVYALQISHVVGGIIGFLFLLIPAMILMHKSAGDIKFMGVMGTFFGGYLTVILIFIASIYGLLFSLVRMYLFKKSTSKTKTAFAPFFLLSFLTIMTYMLF